MESVPPPVRFRLGQALLVVKNPPAKAGNTRDWGQAALLAKRMATHPASTPGESHGQGSLAGCSPDVRVRRD